MKERGGKMRKTIQKYREKKEIKDYFSFVSSYMPNLQVIIKKIKLMISYIFI
jgi:hypothetical protein